MKDYVIHVYNYVRGSGRNIPLAYVNYQGQGNCVHLVKAENHIVAKRLAIREHLDSQTCNHVDRFAK